MQKINSSLGDLSQNPKYAPMAQDIKESLDDALQRWAKPGDRQSLIQARQQYRAYKQIEPAIDPATGNISVPKLMSSLNSKSYGSRNQTLRGRGDQSLVGLARAAKQVIPDNLGNSGTFERSLPAIGVMEALASGDPLASAGKLGAAAIGTNLMGKGGAQPAGILLGNRLSTGLGLPMGKAAAQTAGPVLGMGTALAEKKAEPPDLSTVPDTDASGNVIQRASGGKVDIDSMVNRLMTRWKSAKEMKQI